MKKPIQERIADTMRKVAEGDPTFWRLTLAEAVMSLLEQGKPLTAETLIARLKEGFDHDQVELRKGASQAAIERLTKFVGKVSDEH